MSEGPKARRATPDDADRVATVIAESFREDPLWRVALARPDGSTEHHIELWRIFVAGALRYPWVWVTDGGGAIAIWIPPGGTELTPELESQCDEFVTRQLGPGAGDFHNLSERFEAAHPRDVPHYYLSFLGTHPDHRGQGIGMGLLAHTLDVIDAEHMPAYLESSNPDNDRRYARLGFEPVGEIRYRGRGPKVTTMWRPAR